MQLEPYLFFHGKCEEALGFYAKALRGEIVNLSRVANGVMHATFVAGDVKFMASDGRLGSGPDGEDDIVLSLATNDTAEGERVFTALAEGGKVDQPLENASWGGRFGMLTDKFGVQWMVSIHN